MSGDMEKLVLRAGADKSTVVYVPPASLTVQQIKQQIPAHYFARDTARSLCYLARDLAQVAATFAVMYAVVLPCVAAVEAHGAAWRQQQQSQSQASLYNGVLVAVALAALRALRPAAWAAYWFVQGLNGTALWVLAHECGHHAFSPDRGLNDTIGFVLHSAVLVPYHNWRVVHGNHHKHTNHLTKDTVFVPAQKDHVVELVEETPLYMLASMLGMFLFGWPAHLLFNLSGQKHTRRANHFEPWSPLFRAEDARGVFWSDVGLLAMLGVLGLVARGVGVAAVACWYGVPYLWVNFWLVYITYMQHTDLRIPHYTHEHWTFARGAVAAVDRDYGALLNAWLHHINDSHVVHHLFSQVPFYHAIEITRRHIQRILGDTYVSDKRPLLTALCATWRQCRYVVPKEGVSVFYGTTKRRA